LAFCSVFGLALVFLLARPAAAANACEALSAPPPVFQVAWVSPARARAGAGAWLEVVRVADLRRFVETQTPPLATERFLQLLGLAGPKGLRWYQASNWRITLFDVEADWLCRPVWGAEGGTLLDGVEACDAKLQTGNRFFSGCGYTQDTFTGKRGPDTFRIRWRDAVRGGFCVMPLSRFIAGA
jgi:hypothetical protein